LGLKKRGFGAGKYNGFGGKQEGTETLLQTAVRELEQESGINTQETYLTEVAQLTFTFPEKPDWSQIVHVYLVKKWSSEPVETDEMIPKWFAQDSLPYESMWEADKHWLPLTLQGNYVLGSFVYSGDQRLLEKALQCNPQATPTTPKDL
jgi:8-oxo-dGTP pyrophosphatase MutT (NUDIX family)